MITNAPYRCHGSRSSRPMDDVNAAIRHAGYEDARQALPFRREYDGWNHTAQTNYEWGRQQAVAAHILSGGNEKDLMHSRAPKWARNRILSRCLRAAGVPKLSAVVNIREFVDMTGSAYARWFA